MVVVDVNSIWWAADSPPHPQLSENILSPLKSVLEAGGFWLKAVMDCGNSCYSRLRMEMRMTVDWQGTLMAGLSLLPSIKVKLRQRDDSMWQAYGAQTCWVHTDLSVTVEENCWRWCCCYRQSNHELCFGLLMRIFKFEFFYLIFSNKLNINQKMQLDNVAWNDFNAGHLTCSEHTQTHTLCRRMPTVSLQWFT